MAVLTPQKTQNESRILSEALVPKGTHIAVCIEVEDQFGVERFKYGSETEKELVDLTIFYFGIKKGPDMYVIRSKGFKLSLHEKSALFQFLKGWNNEVPKPGFDTLSMVGHPAQISIEHGMSNKGRTYANISSISPIMEGLEKMVPKAKEFAKLLKPLEKKASVMAPIQNVEEDQDEIPF